MLLSAIPLFAEASEHGNDKGYFRVQFNELPGAAERQRLQQQMQFHRYLGEGKFVCELPMAAADAVSSNPSVTGFEPVRPADKIAPGLNQATGHTDIVLSTYDVEDVKDVAKELEALGATVTRTQTTGAPRIWASADASLVDAMAHVSDVYHMEYDTEEVEFMDKITTTTYMGMDDPQTGSFTGSGIMGQVQDGGCELNHPDFNVDYYDGSVSTGDHGTCTYGIVFSLGTNDMNAQGTLYDATSVFADYNDNSQYDSISHLWNGQFTSGNAGQNGLFQSNSWGHFAFMGYGGYDSYSAESDQASVDYPNLLPLWAAGNSNNGVQEKSLSAEAQSKNGLTVGAIFHQDTADMSDDEWRNDGAGMTPSQGPTADGRQKPDVVGPFDWIYCTDVTGSGGYTSSDYYSDFGGTSGATPVVAGIAGQTYEMYIENHFGNNPDGVIPSAPMVKAILIANAHQYPLADANRNQQGWGSADAEHIYDLGATYHALEDGVSVSAGSSWSTTFSSDGSMPLKITVAWNDPPASESTGDARALKNNLDLKVTGPSGTVWYGNNGLYNSLWSASGTGTNYWTLNNDYRDDLNNVENVFIETPAAGSYTVEVFGRSGDMLDASQTFALAAAGAQSTQYAPPSITVTAPNGGEIWDAGTTQDITWTTTAGDGAITGVDLEYSTDGGSTYSTIVTGTADDGTYSWTVPDEHSSQCLVRATVHDDNGMTGSDVSDSYFDIVGIPPSPPSGLTVEHYGTASVEDTADSAVVSQGTTTNDYTFTHTQDDSYHQVTEVRVGGPANRPKGSLDVVYTVSISGGSSPYTLMLDAYRADSEAYDVSYQVNGGGYSTLGQLTAGSDTDSYLSYTLSGVAAGDTVDIRIVDTQEAVGETMGTLYVDHLYVESAGSGGSTDDNAVNWTASPDDDSGDVVSYDIYRSSSSSGPWDTVYDSVTADGSASYSYIDSGAGEADSTAWWYVVRAVDADGLDDGNTNAVQEPAGDTTPPAKVTGLTATAVSTSQIDLVWDANSESDLDHYNIYRDGALIDSTTLTSYSDTGLSAGTTYTYEVSAVDTSGNEGTLSDPASATTEESTNTMHVQDVYLWLHNTRGPWEDIGVEVTVVDGSGNPLGGVTVDMQLETPEGSTLTATATTDSSGVASTVFDKASRTSGTYTGTATGLTLSGYTWDTTADVETSDTLTTS